MAICSRSSRGDRSSGIPYRSARSPGYAFSKNAQSSAASSSLLRISSLMDPRSASLRPTDWSSNFGHRIPGVSRSSTCLFRRIHWFPLVTPGLFPVLAAAFPAKLLINVDFPTLGIPATMARTGRFKIPRLRSRSIFSLHASWITLWICFKEAFWRASIFITWKPLASKYRVQAAFPASLARSALLSSTIRAFPRPRSSMSGFRLDKGALASTSSIIRSISLISSCMALLAFVIWPGYHCMFILLLLSD